MKRLILMFAAFSALALSGCTFFQDDVYRAMDGVHNDEYTHVNCAVRDAFIAKFGKENVYFIEGHERDQFEHWEYLSPVRAMGLDKQRLRVTGYPRKNADGWFEPLVIARWEIYTAASYNSSQGRHTLLGARGWDEIGRDAKLEAELLNLSSDNMRKRGKGAGGN